MQKSFFITSQIAVSELKRYESNKQKRKTPKTQVER